MYQNMRANMKVFVHIHYKGNIFIIYGNAITNKFT